MKRSSPNEKGPMQQTYNAKRLALILVIIGALFYCYEYVLRIIPSLMLTDLMHYFQLTSAGAGELVGLYYIVYSPLQIAVGLLTDYYHPNKTLSFALLFCIIGCLLFPTPQSYTLTATGRILTGIGSAFAYVGALTLANTWLSKKAFTYFAGMVTSLGMLAGYLSNLNMVSLGAQYGWVNIFRAGAAVGAVLLVIFIVVTSLCHRHEKTLTKSPHINWKTLIIGYWNIIKMPRIWMISVIGSLLFLSLSLFAELWGPSFIHAYLPIPLSQASHISSMVFLGWLVGAPLQGLAYRYLTRYRTIFLFQTILATLMICLVLYYFNSVVSLSIGLFFFGLFSSAEVVCFTYATEVVSKESVGSAVAFVNLIIMLSGTIFQPLSSSLLDFAWSGKIVDGIRVYTKYDFENAFVILPIAGVICIILSFFIKRKIPKTH